jgi:hypothetical protein
MGNSFPRPAVGEEEKVNKDLLMNARLQKLALAAEGRYFQPAERHELLELAKSLPSRLHASDQIQQKEEAIVAAVMQEMQKRYAKFAKQHEHAWAKAFRDVVLVLRFDVQAMVCDEMRWLEEKVLFWLRTMLAAGNFTPQFIRDCFTLLREQVKLQVNPESFTWLQPYLDRNIEVLSDIPEPAAPAV